MDIKTTTGIIAITAILVSAIFISSSPQNFYCPVKAENPYLCYKVSGERCYTNSNFTKYLNCAGGWYIEDTKLDTSNTGAIIKDGRDWRNTSGICEFGSREPIKCGDLK